MGTGWRRVLGVVALAALAAGGMGSVMAQEAPLGPEAACVAGAAGIGDGYYPTTGNGGYDVRHYSLDLEIDVTSSEILRGTATIEALAVADLCSLNLDFEGLTVEEVTVDGAAAEYARRGKEMTVTPEEPLAAGAGFTVEVRYAGTPIIQGGLGDGPGPDQRPAPGAEGIGGADADESSVFGGGWFVNGDEEIFVLGEPTGNRTWFPLNEHPADKATYSFRYTVPEPYVVVANGVKTGETDNGDTTTFAYEARDPMANYLATLHIGRLAVEELEGPGGLPVTLSFAPEVTEDQREVFRRLPEMIEWAEGVFGPYPFETAGATVAGAEFYLALETQTIPIFGTYGDDPDAELDEGARYGLEIILVHEVAHQWFGDHVSVQRWRDIWLNEGFATYSEALWLEHSRGADARDEMLRQISTTARATATFADPEQVAELTARDVFDALVEIYVTSQGDELTEDDAEAIRALLGVGSDAELDEVPAADALAALEAADVGAFPREAVLTGDPGPAELFSTTGVYGRGGLTLHALRLEVGDDVFFEILKAWGERFGGGNAGTEDFVALSEEVSGQELDAFFDAWLLEVALPGLEGIGGEG